MMVDRQLAAEINLKLPPRQDFRIVVISDLNSQYGSTEYEPEVLQAIALIPQWQPDLVLFGGDMIAGQKTSLTKSQIKSMWSAFDTKVAAPFARTKIFPLALPLAIMMDLALSRIIPCFLNRKENSLGHIGKNKT